MSNTTSIILQAAIPLLFAIIGPIVLALVHGLFQKLAAKWHLQNVAEYEAKLDEWVTIGINAAEKASLNATKAGKPPMPGDEKLKLVVDFVTAQITANKLPEKASDAITTLIEGKLHMANGAVTHA